MKILGSNSATPAYGRNQSAQVLNYNETFYLIDCGEGTQLQMGKFGVKTSKIKYIFISHLHGDHYLGLMGLLSSMHLGGRKKEIHLFGPKELENLIALHLQYSQSELQYPLIFHPTQSDAYEMILDTNELQVFSFPLNHRIPCTGFRFNEKKTYRKINKKRIENLKIPAVYFPLIKNGESFTAEDGRVYTSDELTLPAPKPRSYGYCSDTLFGEEYLPFVAEVDLLYHESTFLQNLLPRADSTFHSTAFQAATAAKKAKAGKLLLGHFSARYKDLVPLLEEAQSCFPNAALAIEGETFSVGASVED